MATSLYQTAENVKFNGTTSNAVVLKNNAGVKSLIVCSKVSDADMTLLDALITANGGVTPMVTPTSGKAAVTFKTAAAATDATGLLATATGTAGTATVLVGGNKTTGSATGLSSFTGTSGSQTVLFSAVKVGTDATGLVGATTYTATVTVDGVAKPISILGSAAATFTTLLSEINVDLGSAAVATLVNGNIKITSATGGTSSKVVITAGTLFAAPLAGFNRLGTSTIGSGQARKYSALVVVDGVAKNVTFTGVQGNTYANLITEINADLGATATAALTGGNIVITSATTGAKSSVVVYDGGLFAALTNYSGITVVAGAGPRVYTAKVVIDGVSIALSVQGSAAQLLSTLVTSINTALSTAGTAAVTNGNLVITSATTGNTSTVEIIDGDLFHSLTGFRGVRTLTIGATDMLTVVQRERSANGSSFANLFKVETVGAKPSVPVKAPDMYFDGTVWRKFSDNTVLNA